MTALALEARAGVTLALSAEDSADLALAVRLLASPGIAVRAAGQAGRPFDWLLGQMPAINNLMRDSVHAAVAGCLTIAIETLDERSTVPQPLLSRALAAMTGGVGGMFGPIALPVELPLTMTLMLRSIADIGRRHGERLETAEARVACLEVFALGSAQAGGGGDYYAARARMAPLAGEAVTAMGDSSRIDVSAPVVWRLIAEIAGRFSLLFADRVVSGLLPVLGGVGGAAYNVVFMDHFDRIATAHFLLRGLERRHGRETVVRLYHRAAAELG
jgi:hypothetical protein